MVQRASAAGACLLLQLITVLTDGPCQACAVAAPRLFPVVATPSGDSKLEFQERSLCQSGAFQSGAWQFATGTGSTCAPPRGVASGDLNGDGYLDIVAVHIWAPVGIWFGGFGGTFTAATPSFSMLQDREHPPKDGTAFNGGYGVLLEDLDGDGDLDVYVLKSCSCYLDGGQCYDNVFFNDGTGTFSLETSTQLSSGYVPFDGDGFSCSDGSPGNAGVPKVYLADLTADEHKDIFVCAGFAQPRLFVRTSSASDWSVVTDSPLISEGPCLSAMIADINEDGFNDVFICNVRDPSDPYQNPFYYSGYKVFHGSSTGFEDVTSHWSAWLVNWLGCYGSAPTAVDFNEDGLIDMFFPMNKVYLGVRPTSTTRGFQYLNPSTSGLEWSNNEDGTASDVNGDGHADVLIVGSSGFWKLFLGHGDATFTEISNTPLNIKPMGTNPQNKAFFFNADFDADGRLDFFIYPGEPTMTATSSIVHLAQSGPQGLGPLREVFAQPAQDIDACNKPVDCGLFCSCIERWANMAISDMNNDGFDDMFILSEYGASEMHIGDGTGRFIQVSHPFGGASTWHDIVWFIVGDLSGDGVNDFFHFDAENFYSGKFYFGTASGGFTQHTNVADDLSTVSPSGNAGAKPSSVVSLDYNRDGVNDILVTWQWDSGITPSAIANELYHYISTSNTFERVASDDQLAGVLLQPSTSSLTQALTCDFNEDGHNDVFFTRGSDPSQLFLTDDAGGYQAATGLTTSVPSGGAVCAVCADFNNDEHVDVMVFGFAQLLVGDGAGGFTQASNDGSGMYEVDVSRGRYYPYNALPLAADVDNDGDVDLLFHFRGGHGFSELYANLGTGIFVRNNEGPLGTGLDAHGSTSTDFNGDGLVDVFTGGMSVRRMFIARPCTDGYASALRSFRTRMHKSCDASSNFATRSLAENACGAGCYGIYDPGCDNSGTWRICRTSELHWTPSSGDCVYEAMRDTMCYACPTFGLARMTSPASACEYCPAGRVGPTGMTAIGDGEDYLCLVCEAGKYRNVSDNVNSCTQCQTGQFSPAGAASCSVCDPGRVPNTLTAAGASSCVSCTPGRAPNLIPISISNNADLGLEPGHEADHGAHDAIMMGGDERQSIQHHTTTYVPAQTTCELCTGHTYSEIGYACTTCAAPYVLNSLRTSCTACPAGRGPNDGRTHCTRCSVGNYSTIGVCTDCVAPNRPNADRTACVQPYRCPAGHFCLLALRTIAPRDCVSEDDCTPCPVGTVNDGSQERCSSCNEFGKATNSIQSNCEACGAGTEPATNRSKCVACTGNSASALGVICTRCSSGRATNAPLRTQCQDLSALSANSNYEGGTGVTDKAVIADVLETSENILPAVDLTMTLDEDLIDSFDTDAEAESAFLARFLAEMALHLGVDSSELKVSRKIDNEGRRRMQSMQMSISVTLGQTTDSTTLISDLETQLSDLSSPLMTSSITSLLSPLNGPIGVRFACKRGMYRQTGDSDCGACQTGSVPDNSQAYCTKCHAGQYAGPMATSCIDCEAGDFDHDSEPATPCISCPAGKINSRAKAATCEECPGGRTSEAGSTACSLCPPLYFSYSRAAECKKCGDLILPLGLSADFREKLSKMLNQPEACPGGQPGVDAVIRHLPRVWIHQGFDVNSSDSIELLRCQTEAACRGADEVEARMDVATNSSNMSIALSTNSSRRLADVAVLGATCGIGFRQGSFLCGQCDDGYVKLGGDCIKCAGFNFLMLASSLFVNVGMALFLLHKSANPVIGKDELAKIWDKVDREGSERLNKTGVGKVLELLGALPELHAMPESTMKDDAKRQKMHHLNDQRRVKLDRVCEEINKKRIEDSTGSTGNLEATQKKKCGCFKHKRGAIQVHEASNPDTDCSEVQVTKEDFVAFRASKSPSAAMGIIVFFLQSLGLIMKDSGAFGIMEALNLDTEKAAKSCVSPLSTIHRFYAKITLIPAILFLGVCIMIPVWNRLRQARLLTKVWTKMDAPLHVKTTHFKRALLNTYLFCYAPLTQNAVQMLICVNTCNDGTDCEMVMEVDYGLACSSSGVKHAQVVAVLVLAIMCLAVPLLLLHWAYQGVRERKVSLALQLSDIDTWFDEIDRDQSGQLEKPEIRELLYRMRYVAPEDSEILHFIKVHARQWVTYLQKHNLTEQGKKPADYDASCRRAFYRAIEWEKKQAQKLSSNESKALQATIAEIHNVWVERVGEVHRRVDDKDADVVGPITKEQFEAWFISKLESMASTPYDVLYGTTKYSAYWWFAQVLLLKTIINVLFSFGRAVEFEWHVWMHLLLGTSVCLMVLVQPYRESFDENIELVALLCLAVVTHVASLYQAGDEFSASYLVLVFLMTCIPLIVLVALKGAMLQKTKKRMHGTASNFESGLDTVKETGDAPREESQKCSSPRLPCDTAPQHVHMNDDGDELDSFEEQLQYLDMEADDVGKLGSNQT